MCAVCLSFIMLTKQQNSNMMIPGFQGHKLDACIQINEFETQTNMRKQPGRADFECL